MMEIQTDATGAIGVGILGFAHGHVNAYCQRWRENPAMGVKVVAGWDHDPARLDAAREQHGLEPADSPAALLARADVAAVVISSETAFHAELVEQAAAAGKAIIVQKPMALTLEEANRMVAAVERAGVPFTMAWQMRVDPQNQKVKELLDSGKLGRLYYVRRRHGLGTHVWPGFENTWHVNPAMNLDIWADDSAHPIDFILWLLGEPESVTAELATLQNPKVPNDNGVALFRFADGHLAEVACSFTCLGAENTTEVYAENGSIVQNFGDGVSTTTPRPEGTDSLKWFLREDGQWHMSGIPSPAGHGERIASLAGPLADFLHGWRGPIATVHEGRIALRMVLACYRSSEEGRRVRLDEIQSD